MAEHKPDVFHHIRDAYNLELPNVFGGNTQIFPSFPIPGTNYSFQLTKFMVLEVVAAVIVLVIFSGLARRVASGKPAHGRFWNFWEMLAIFIRDEVARPAIGTGHHDHDPHADETPPMDFSNLGTDGQIKHPTHEHDAAHQPPPTGEHPADKYLPYIWSCFFFVLICNLLGAIPWLGSATGSISVTAVLAVVTLAMVIISGSQKLGVAGFWKHLCPTMDLPGPIAIALIPMIWVIEFVGLMIKHGVLAVRLFANIMAGHTVIAVILLFIQQSAGSPLLFWVVAPASVFGQVAIGLLELFVAFLQAYIFAFLSALFIGAAVHPH